MSPREKVRFFTLEEANRTLPLVRRIVEDIVAEHERLQRLLRRLEEARRTPGAGIEPLREEVARVSSTLEGFLGELHALGCVFKGAPDGLVDFYSLRDGRPVFLCWKLGEEEIGWWHDLEAGFAGREPIGSGVLPSAGRAYGSEG